MMPGRKTRLDRTVAALLTRVLQRVRPALVSLDDCPDWVEYRYVERQMQNRVHCSRELHARNAVKFVIDQQVGQEVIGALFDAVGAVMWG